MNRIRNVSVVTVALLTAISAQVVQVNKTNKTITVTSEEKVTADSEVAEVKIGYHAYGQNKEQAFDDVVLKGNAITSKILKSGVTEKNIETAEVSLEGVRPDDNWTPQMKNTRLFKAKQFWRIRVAAADAQRLIDIGIASGANEVETPEWNIADPAALQAKASAAGLTKARKIAEQMAAGLGAHLGELVYASNRAPVVPWQYAGTEVNNAMTELVEVEASAPSSPKLKVFPQKVESQATVYAVFSIE